RQWLMDFQHESGCLLHLIQIDAGMQAEDFHPASPLVEAKDRQVGDDAERPRSRRQSGLFARPGTREVAGGGQEIEFLHKAATIVGGYDQDSPAQGSEVIGPATAGQAHLWPLVLPADVRGVEIAVRI